MAKTSHREKLLAALRNPKCIDDKSILEEAYNAYEYWISSMRALKSTGKQKIEEIVGLLNEYKNYLEVELIAKHGSGFIKRQKGQLKLDNSVLEEFFIHIIDPSILLGLPPLYDLEVGPHTAFMSLSFAPPSINDLSGKPQVVIKHKNQDFALGKTMHYIFSSSAGFEAERTAAGSFYLAVLAAEIKVNYDKTMFQECAGTAARLKQGCPIAKYYALVEYLDMEPEDCRLTEIDNVFLLRKTKRLPYGKREDYNEVRRLHEQFPIDAEIVWKFVQEIQNFVNAVWYDPQAALKRGSFI